MADAMELSHVTMQFGGVVAVDLSMHLTRMKLYLGPQLGAGKTTAFNCITGVYTPPAARSSVTS